MSTLNLNKVLVVDDSKLIHQMYRLVLMRYKNCTLMDAMNGLEALDILSRENGIDLILLDINMPVMNGVQFMEKLQKDNLYRNIPIIVISTDGKEEDTIRAMKLGAWGYIVKPFKSEALHDLLEKVIAKKSSALMETVVKH
ncbi:MAG: Chemotaxis protein CheY [candidate division WS2 bacterium]|nr:Chemotaxis protein CheY [Candidatus Lithacetigena glycinireducens]